MVGSAGVQAFRSRRRRPPSATARAANPGKKPAVPIWYRRWWWCLVVEVLILAVPGADLACGQETLVGGRHGSVLAIKLMARRSLVRITESLIMAKAAAEGSPAISRAGFSRHHHVKNLFI